jgi:hypothetical protein
MRLTAARLLLAPALALALAAAVATTAAADGGPGTTFPEQPGGNVASGCAAVIAHTTTGLANASPAAVGITGALLADACFAG